MSTTIPLIKRETSIAELMPRVGIASLSSPMEVGARRAGKAAAELANIMASIGCSLVPLGPIDTPALSETAGRRLAEEHVDAVVLASASWFEDYLVLDLLEECNVPVLLWSLPGMQTGALCGSQQLTSVLKYMGASYKCVYGPIAEGDCLDQARQYLRAAALKTVFRRSRIGLVGNRVNGMSHASANEFALKKVIGPRIVPLDMPTLLQRAEAIPVERARPLWESILQQAAECHVSDEDGMYPMRFYLSVKDAMLKHGLNGLAVGCYPNLMGRVCLTASLLADEGIPLSCEGDVNGAVAQIMLTRLTAQPTHNADWLEPLEDGSMIFTHCGSGSLSLAESSEDITLDSVRLMGQGVCALFPARTGPVTLVSLTPTQSGYQCAVLEGEALSADMVFPGNPVRVRFGRPIEEIIEWVHDEGISHHWMIGYGHVATDIREWARIAGPGIQVIQI